MTIYAPPPPPFTCAICCKNWQPDHRRPMAYSPQLPMPPVCNSCNITWGKSIGGWGDRNRDRRIIRQIAALAAVLEVEANRKNRNERPLHG